MFVEGLESQRTVQSTNCFSHESKETLGWAVPARPVALTLGWCTALVPGYGACQGRADPAAGWHRGWRSVCHLVLCGVGGPVVPSHW